MKALQDDDDNFTIVVPLKLGQRRKWLIRNKTIELVEVEEQGLICRCIPSLLVKTLKKLNTKQKNVVYDMGFGILFYIRVNEIP